ncbi:ABC-2 family transporter protein [Paenibacillus pasadenensis]|uniref:ABC transporter permease n=1 Tax=Paenibacillus pasadenensis TaxID=217090 RepID=UPI00203DC3ED|nr:ABC-2 family transporter protein [Paenibacillus pasadenensis]MCM3748555.1 ABC-2 family transporter protein [Paenibacillus pasadenensis]
MLFYALARASYSRNLQYRASHLLHNIASALFGFIYLSIWTGIGEGRDLGVYGLAGLVSYVALNQCLLWITAFSSFGLGIPALVRTGAIATELARPVHLFYNMMSREWGNLWYQALYKSFPIYMLYVLLIPLRFPSSLTNAAVFIAAVLGAAYLSICIQYLIGAVSLWTTESHWLHWLNHAMFTLFSGFLIPVEWLPGWLGAFSRWSVYPCLQYIPARIYLGMDGASALLPSLFWCAFLTVACLAVTRLMRFRTEVQGG